MTGAQDKAREPERCHICGAEMSAENPEICKNFHVQQPAQGKIIYSSVPWKIYEQDAGMGERDYAVMLNDIFFCRTEYSQTAHKIIIAVNRPHTPAPEHSVSLTAIEIALRREDCPSENVQWAIEHLNQYQERQETASPHPPAPDYDAIRKKVLEEVDTDDWLREKIDEEREQAASTATLTENQRIMRLIGTYLSYHGVEIHERQGEKYYVVEGTFSLASFIQYIESLRSTAGDEPEKRAEGGVRR